MKKLLLWVIAVATVPMAVAGAQEAPAGAAALVGTWQGAIASGGSSLRYVFVFAKDDGGGIKGTGYALDVASLRGQRAPVGLISLRDGEVKFTDSLLGFTFEGKLSADGNTIAGSWRQLPVPQPLKLERASKETAWTIPEAVPEVPWMAANASLELEVATVKPTNPTNGGNVIQAKGRRLTTVGTTFSRLICWAYEISPNQYSGGPSWIETDRFDITAVPEGAGQPTYEQWRLMLRKLLADRFQLKFHLEPKEMPVYAVTVAKGGPKLTKSGSTDPKAQPGMFLSDPYTWPGMNVSMHDFCSMMQRNVLDRPVVDQTGLTGRYDFVFRFTSDRTPPVPEGTEPPPSVFTAAQEQLGLKFEATKAPVDVIVIDHVERPSEN